MSPSELKKSLEKQLVSARTTLMSKDFVFQVEKKNAKTQAEAGVAITKVQSAILKLKETRVRQVQEGLKKNEGLLVRAGSDLQKGLKKPQDTTVVLKAVNNVLNALGGPHGSGGGIFD